MKNKIIMIILFVSIILVLFLAIFGIKIINKNKNINSNIDTVTQLTSISYPERVSDLETTIDSLNVEKEKYEQISGLTADDKTKVYETEKYDIGYLWTTLGHYATKNKINLSIDVKQSTGTDLYDLYFTVQGEYVNISSFITKIENDSDLKFRIYNFKLVPGSSDVELNSTFVVKDININDKTLIKSSELTQTEDTQTGEAQASENSNTINNITENTVQVGEEQ